jgi:group I intron endonuclease
MNTGIYKISSKTKFSIYIGSAFNIESRWNRHLKDLKQNKHHSTYLQRHYNKYGIEDLVFEILEICKKEELIIKEQIYLDSLKCNFNTCKIAGSCLGIKRNEEFKKKISEKVSGVNNPTYGLVRTKEWRDKISKANSGKISGFKGKNHSKENKDRMSVLAKNRVFSEETKIKISNKAKIKVMQYDKSMNFIKEWNSIKEASQSLNIDSGSIVHVLKNKPNCKSAGGFIWKYK